MTVFCDLVLTDGTHIGRAAIAHLPPIGYTIDHGCETYRIRDARLLKPKEGKSVQHRAYDEVMLLVEKIEKEEIPMSRRDKYRNRGRPDLREIDDPERFFEEEVIKASVNNAKIAPSNNTLALLSEIDARKKRIEELEAENRKLASRLFIAGWLLAVAGFGAAAYSVGWFVIGFFG